MVRKSVTEWAQKVSDLYENEQICIIREEGIINDKDSGFFTGDPNSYWMCTRREPGQMHTGSSLPE